jgi:PhnB protein
MTSTLNPYINFKDDARQALEFYRDALGGELAISTFGEYGDKDAPEADLVMHGQLTTDAGFTLMCSDAPPGMDASVSGGFAVSLSGDDETELRGYWDKLSAGGQVTVPLEKQMWGDTFGMVTDKFGIDWMVNIAGQPQG